MGYCKNVLNEMHNIEKEKNSSWKYNIFLIICEE